jgi:hypothetical protein
MQTDIQLRLRAQTVPDGKRIPATLQGIVNAVTQYVRVAAQGLFRTIIVGQAEPSPVYVGYPWLKVDATGAPIGIYAYAQSGWSPLSIPVPSGPTSARPSAPVAENTLYYDETIEQLLVYRRNLWRTTWGGRGMYIHVFGTSEADVEQRYPGWVIAPEARGRCLTGAGAGPNLTPRDVGEVYGAEKVSLAREQLPAHTHLVVANTRANDAAVGPAQPVSYNYSGGNWGYELKAANGGPSAANAGTSSEVGQNQPHDNIPPSLAVYILKKL